MMNLSKRTAGKKVRAAITEREHPHSPCLPLLLPPPGWHHCTPAPCTLSGPSSAALCSTSPRLPLCSTARPRLFSGPPQLSTAARRRRCPRSVSAVVLCGKLPAQRCCCSPSSPLSAETPSRRFGAARATSWTGGGCGAERCEEATGILRPVRLRTQRGGSGGRASETKNRRTRVSESGGNDGILDGNDTSDSIHDSKQPSLGILDQEYGPRMFTSLISECGGLTWERDPLPAAVDDE
eukprot:779227-Rhodomonas_salina.1